MGINPVEAQAFLVVNSPKVTPHPEEVFPNQCLHMIRFQDFKVVGTRVLSVLVGRQRWSMDIG